MQLWYKGQRSKAAHIDLDLNNPVMLDWKLGVWRKGECEWSQYWQVRIRGKHKILLKVMYNITFNERYSTSEQEMKQ